MPLDLTPQEREECIQEYLEVFRLSSGSAVHEMQCRIRLGKVGLDKFEIDQLIRENRP